jgi:hypothetical protein
MLTRNSSTGRWYDKIEQNKMLLSLPLQIGTSVGSGTLFEKHGCTERKLHIKKIRKILSHSIVQLWYEIVLELANI